MLIGARTAAWGGDKSYDVQDYVGWETANLLTMVDGIRNIGATVDHSLSSATWNDLVGSCHLTLGLGGTWGSDHLICDGLKQGATTATNLPDYQTIEVVLSCETDNLGCVVSGRPQTGKINRYVFSMTGGYTPADLNIAGVAVSDKTAIHHIAFTYTNKTVRNVTQRYLDGNPVAGDSSIGNDNNCSEYFALGGRSNTLMLCKCNIYAVRTYYDALSDDDIAHNYAVDAARFALSANGGGYKLICLRIVYAASCAPSARFCSRPLWKEAA